MPSLLLIVFLLQLVIHLVNSFGASALNAWIWSLYNKAPTPTAKAYKEQVRLRREVLKLRTQMNATSSQDEFAKWAKLRRAHDKTLAQYEKLSSSLNGSKAKFDSSFTVARYACTNGLRIVLQFWYAKQPLFWIPQGWLPSYVEWVLSFPRAPRGSISIQIWGIACASVISMLHTAITSAVALVVKQNGNGNGKNGKAQPQTVPTAGAKDSPKGQESPREKEL